MHDRIVQIRAYATALTQEVRKMDQRRFILRPLVTDDDLQVELNNMFDKTYGAHAFNHLRPLLAQDLVRDVVRLFLDEGDKAGSLKNLYRKANDRKLNKALRNEFKKIPDKWHEDSSPIAGLSEEESRKIRAQWSEKDRDDFAASFDDGWGKVSEAIERLNNDEVVDKIKIFRDKYHSHFEMKPLGVDPGPVDISQLGLTYNELDQFIDTYMPHVFELTRVLTGNVFDVRGFSDVHKRYADDMWRIFARLNENEG